MLPTTRETILKKRFNVSGIDTFVEKTQVNKRVSVNSKI